MPPFVGLRSVSALAKPTGLLAAALLLAVLADALFCGEAWGLNVGLWAITVVAVAAWAKGPMRIKPNERALAIGVVGFALLFALRDSDALKIANGLALAFCLGALVLPRTVGGLRNSPLSRLLYAPFTGLAALVSGFGRIAKGAAEERKASTEAGRRSKAILRGLALATPLLLVFGGLFASADAVFREDLASLFRFDVDFDAITSRFWTFAFALVFAGGLLHRLAFREPPAPDRPRAAGRVGGLEVGVVLGSLAALFGAFLAVQFRFLFGGGDLVRVVPGLSYAEYARGGFFELVVVAALALAVVLGTDALLRRERAGDDLAFRFLGRVLGVEVLCVVASALLRMRLYTQAFGLTELRLYSTVFMGWLALGFSWLFFTTLRGRPHRFAFGLFAAGLVTILATNLLNPDALIVRTNLSKPNADFAYLSTLSDDAALALRDSGRAVPARHRAEAVRLVEKRRAHDAKGDWRELNLARWRLGY